MVVKFKYKMLKILNLNLITFKYETSYFEDLIRYLTHILH